jgi:hypothetical protein
MRLDQLLDIPFHDFEGPPYGGFFVATEAANLNPSIAGLRPLQSPPTRAFSLPQTGRLHSFD